MVGLLSGGQGPPALGGSEASETRLVEAWSHTLPHPKILNAYWFSSNLNSLRTPEGKPRPLVDGQPWGVQAELIHQGSWAEDESVSALLPRASRQGSRRPLTTSQQGSQHPGQRPVRRTHGDPSGLHFPRLEGAAEQGWPSVQGKVGVWEGPGGAEGSQRPQPPVSPWSCSVSPNADSSPG